MNRIGLIVTRHPGLVEYLHELGMAAEGVEVIAHATPEKVAGRHVCGVLPHSLSCLAASFTEVPLALPAELRGAELSLEQVREYASAPVTYVVRALPPADELVVWNDQIGNRNRQGYCILADGEGKLWNFTGSPIKGVCKSRVLESEQAGKWSCSTYQIQLLNGGHVAWRGHEDFNTRRITGAAQTWAELAAAWGVTEDEVRVFLPGLHKESAEFLSALEG